MYYELNKSIYESNLDRLSSQFGDRSYSAERRKLLYSMCKNLTEFEFIEMINYMIMHCRLLPLQREFENGLAYVREQSNYRAKQLQKMEVIGAFKSNVYDEFEDVIPSTKKISQNEGNQKPRIIKQMVKLYNNNMYNYVILKKFI